VRKGARENRHHPRRAAGRRRSITRKCGPAAYGSSCLEHAFDRVQQRLSQAFSDGFAYLILPWQTCSARCAVSFLVLCPCTGDRKKRCSGLVFHSAPNTWKGGSNLAGVLGVCRPRRKPQIGTRAPLFEALGHGAKSSPPNVFESTHQYPSGQASFQVLLEGCRPCNQSHSSKPSLLLLHSGIFLFATGQRRPRRNPAAWQSLTTTVTNRNQPRQKPQRVHQPWALADVHQNRNSRYGQAYPPHARLGLQRNAVDPHLGKPRRITRDDAVFLQPE